MIEIRDLWKSFGQQPVLRGVNLTIEHGETMVIIGRSGGGKSVLLKHIVGLLHPDRGEISVDGVDIFKASHHELDDVRRKFGVLFQGAALFDSMTVGGNVGLGLRSHTKLSEADITAKITECLGRVGMPGIEAKKPAELSGGMRKRVGLARAIAMDPEYVLYDEPTTGLDPIMAEVINTLIIKMREDLKCTSVAVTHDMHSAYRIADRIAMLYEGEIIFTGTPDECRATDNAFVQQFITGTQSGPIETVVY